LSYGPSKEGTGGTPATISRSGRWPLATGPARPGRPGACGRRSHHRRRGRRRSTASSRPTP